LMKSSPGIIFCLPPSFLSTRSVNPEVRDKLPLDSGFGFAAAPE